MDEKTKADFVTIILLSSLVAVTSVFFTPIGGLIVLGIILILKGPLYPKKH